METLPPVVIIWCDNNFQYEDSHESMKKEIITSTDARSIQDADEISALILVEDREQFRSNAVPLFTVRTSEEVMKHIEENDEKKIFLISSGSVGRYLVPKVASLYLNVREFYIFTHNIGLHIDWVDNYNPYVKTFDHPMDLLLRLTRDISSYFIKQGRIFLQRDAPQDALACFIRARNLENYANRRDKMESSVENPRQNNDSIEFRDNLNILEGKNGLITEAEKNIRALGYSLQSDPM